MTLLTICQDAASEIGLPKPPTIVNATDPNASQLLSLVNRAGRSLAKAHNWQALVTETSFTTVATESQGALTTIASDFDHFLNDTMYNRSKTWKVVGPRTPRSWAAEKGLVSAGIRDTVRIRGDNIIMTPTPTAGESIYFEYVSNQWCESSGGTGQTYFQADTDVARLSEELLTLSLVYRFLKAKGFAYGEQKDEFDAQLSLAKARDGGAATLDIAGGGIRFPRVPEGNWDLS